MKLIAYEGEILKENKLSNDILNKELAFYKKDPDEYVRQIKKSIKNSKSVLTFIANAKKANLGLTTRYKLDETMHLNSLQQNQQVIDFLRTNKVKI